MTRQLTAREIKRNSHGGAVNADRRPHEGSRLRRAYDLLRAGAVISLTAVAGRRAQRDLRDYYGMELVGVPNVGTRCIGEWEGDIFVPIERLAPDAVGEAA